jgi:hypothetical protein
MSSADRVRFTLPSTDFPTIGASTLPANPRDTAIFLGLGGDAAVWGRPFSGFVHDVGRQIRNGQHTVTIDSAMALPVESGNLLNQRLKQLAAEHPGEVSYRVAPGQLNRTNYRANGTTEQVYDYQVIIQAPPELLEGLFKGVDVSWVGMER